MRGVLNTEKVFWSRVKKTSKCWFWLGTKWSTDYGTFTLNWQPWLVHRLAWTFRFGPIPHGMQVLHKCDVHSCVRPSHLFLGTQSDNLYDMVRKGRAQTGDKHWTRRFPQKALRNLRRIVR